MLTQSEVDPGTIFSAIRDGGSIAILLLLSWAWITGRIHTDKELQSERKEKEFYRDLALRSVNVGDKLAGVTKATTEEDKEDMVREAVKIAVEVAVAHADQLRKNTKELK